MLGANKLNACGKRLFCFHGKCFPDTKLTKKSFTAIRWHKNSRRCRKGFFVCFFVFLSYISSIPALALMVSLTAGPLFSQLLQGPLAFFRYFSVGVQLLRTVMHDEPSSV